MGAVCAPRDELEDRGCPQRATHPLCRPATVAAAAAQAQPARASSHALEIVGAPSAPWSGPGVRRCRQPASRADSQLPAGRQLSAVQLRARTVSTPSWLPTQDRGCSLRATAWSWRSWVPPARHPSWLPIRQRWLCSRFLRYSPRPGLAPTAGPHRAPRRLPTPRPWPELAVGELALGQRAQRSWVPPGLFTFSTGHGVVGCGSGGGVAGAGGRGRPPPTPTGRRVGRPPPVAVGRGRSPGRGRRVGRRVGSPVAGRRRRPPVAGSPGRSPDGSPVKAPGLTIGRKCERDRTPTA